MEPDIIVIPAERATPQIVASAMQRYIEELKYNPGQPRDKDGKWSSGGGRRPGGAGGASSDDPEITSTPESRAIAAKLYAHAKEVEPEISAEVARLAGDLTPDVYDDPATSGTGQLFGYDFRLKAEDAIAVKIERVVQEKGMTREEAAQDIKDSVRFTIHYPDDSFGGHAQGVVDALRDQNASVVVKNTWPPEAGAYKGINVQVTRHDGIRFEVQLHTPQSQKIKDQMHVLYEKQRVLPRSSPMWNDLENEMTRLSRELPVPTGAMEVFKLMEDGPTKWFLAVTPAGRKTAAARWYWPGSTTTEHNLGDGWREAHLLMSLTEDTGWVESTEAEVEKFLEEIS
jgi:hypothetical protein